jgi:HAD superfamily hydrolase (TIGR01549 family)
MSPINSNTLTKKIKAVLFDVDDTLFDRVSAHRKTLEIIVYRYPEVFDPFPFAGIFAAWEESDRLAMIDFNSGAPSEGLRDAISRRFLNLLGLPEAHSEAITAAYVQDYPEIIAPVAGAVRLVRRLSRHMPVGVVTNGLPDVQYRKLETLGLRKMLTCVVLSEEIGIRKPDPRIFQRASELLKVPPGNCLYTGDSYATDILGAKTTGMMTCWFNHSNTPAPDNFNAADFIITQLIQLNSILF